MPEYKPKDTRFRAYRWWGDVHELPRDWFDRIVVAGDGTLVVPNTHNGPAVAKPDGEWYVREHAPEANDDELWPVARHIFEAAYEQVQP